MIIRKCLERDIGPAGQFYDRVVLWLDQHINYPKWIYGVYPSEETVRKMTAAGDQYICLAQGQEDRIIGAFILNDDPQGNYQKGMWKKDLPDGAYMVLHTLAIEPNLQGQGLGSEIIRFCQEKAKGKGYLALRLDIVPENQPARIFYEKNGFSYAGNADLGRRIEGIPMFSLFELNWDG